MLEYDFLESVGFWIHTSAHLYERQMNSELNTQGITYRQCQVLGWLALEGESSQVLLAERMRIEPATLVGVLDRMEREGLLVRVPSLEDRRKKMIRPLPKAKPVWKKIVACAERVRARATAGMTPEQVQVLYDLLRQVQHNLEPEQSAHLMHKAASQLADATPPAPDQS